jgi:hypothetical protein
MVGTGFTVTLKLLLELDPLTSAACSENGGEVVELATAGAVPLNTPPLLMESQPGNPEPLQVNVPVPPVAAMVCV